MKIGSQTTFLPQVASKEVRPAEGEKLPAVSPDRVETSSTDGPGLGEKLGKLKVFVRPAVAAAAGIAAGAGVTALAATGGWSALAMTVPAAIVGGVAGVVVGVVNQPKEYGYLAGLGKAISGGINGAVGLTAATVASAAVVAGTFGGATGATLAAVGGGAIGVVGLGWGLNKLAECLTPRY